MTTTSGSPTSGTPAAGAPATTIDQKRTWLDVLAILHYVYGGFVVVGILVAAVAVVAVFGIAGIEGDLGVEGCLPLAFAALFLGLALAYGVVNLLAGRWLQQRRGWVGIVVVSAVNSLNVPLGTLLGVFTIVVLAADDVRALFAEERPAAAA